MIEELKRFQKYNPDLKIRKLKNSYVIYFETLCDSESINNFILKPINYNDINDITDIKKNIPSGNIVEIKKNDDVYDLLYSGFTVVCVNNSFIAFETKFELNSAISEATNEKVIKGPKDAFTENYQINLGLIRKRIRSKNLKVEEYKIGTKSKTKVSLIYMDDIANKDFVKKISKKLKQINIDYVANSNYIIEMFNKKNYTMPTTLMTERPDYVSFNLLEGRIAILIENTPQVLVLPAFFSDYIKTIDDYYQNTKNVSITRLIRITALFISIVIPGLYIALTTYNQETLSTSLLVNFSIQRSGVPFPTIVEALLMWLIFEILKESDTRIPLVVGTSMSIVGALVLGQAAVEAGLISPIMIIIIAVSSVASFLFNDNDFVSSIRIWKLIFIILSGFAGLYGLFLAILLLIIRITSINSYGYDYSAPNAPLNLKMQEDNIVLDKKYKLNKRLSILTRNINRR